MGRSSSSRVITCALILLMKWRAIGSDSWLVMGRLLIVAPSLAIRRNLRQRTNAARAPFISDGYV